MTETDHLYGVAILHNHGIKLVESGKYADAIKPLMVGRDMIDARIEGYRDRLKPEFLALNLAHRSKINRDIGIAAMRGGASLGAHGTEIVTASRNNMLDASDDSTTALAVLESRLATMTEALLVEHCLDDVSELDQIDGAAERIQPIKDLLALQETIQGTILTSMGRWNMFQGVTDGDKDLIRGAANLFESAHANYLTDEHDRGHTAENFLRYAMAMRLNDESIKGRSVALLWLMAETNARNAQEFGGPSIMDITRASFFLLSRKLTAKAVQKRP